MDKANNYHIILHEIKNSITFVNSSLQLVKKKHPEVASFDFWAESMQELSHLQQLLADLSANRPFEALCFKPTSIRAVLSSAITPFYKDTLDGRLQFQISCPNDIDTVFVDPVRLKNVLANLVKNACEAMNSNGIITLTISHKNQDLFFSITDNGPGIAKENVGKIFEPFFTTKPDGTGLGLQVARQIVEGHHGTLSLTANGPHGCTFQIILPSAIQK